MSLRKKTGKGIILLRLTVIYAIFTAAAVFIAVAFINSFIYVDASESSGADNKPQITAENSTAKTGTNTAVKSNAEKWEKLHSLTGIPSDASFLQFSSDGQYCVYCFKGTIYIKNEVTDKTVKQISEKDAITYAVLMYDRNIVIYFTAGNAISTEKAGSSEEITVYTYNIDTGMKTMQRSLRAGNRTVIRQVDYSTMTGHVSFDVFNGKSDEIYYINLMKRLVRIPAGGPVENMVLANSLQAIYYEKGNILYYQSWPVKSLRRTNTKLLGCDLKDYVYVQSLSDKTLVYVLKGTVVVRKIRLDDAGFTKVYSNKTNVYLVYSGYILDLSANPVEKTAYDKGDSFKGLINHRIYLSDNNGDIIPGTVPNQK